MIGLLARLFIKDHKNYADAEVRTKYGILTGIAGIVLNFLLFLGKLAVGLICSSVSVTADAFNNLSDAGSSVVSIACYKIAAMPADKEHPFGHGRAEYIAAFIVSASIIFMAFEIAKEALGSIFSPAELETDMLSVGVLMFSILVKLYIFAYNRRFGRLVGSAPMKAVALDSLSDCVSTFSALAALGVYMIWGINIDGYVGLFISAIIMKAGINAAKESLTPLLGEKADDEYIERIKETVTGYDNVLGVHDLSVHNYGVNKNVVSLHAELPASMTFVQAHDLIDTIESEIREKYSAEVIIHMDPVFEQDEQTEAFRALATELARSYVPDATIHDLRLTERDGRKRLIFDIEVPFGLALSDDEIKSYVVGEISRRYSDIGISVTVDKKIY